MDSQLASVLTSASLEVQNGSQGGLVAKEMADVHLNPKETALTSTKPGNLKSCLEQAELTIRQDAHSIKGKKPEVGATTEPAIQEASEISGFGEPITLKAKVPALVKQPIRIKIVVPQQCKKEINSAMSLTKDFVGSEFKGSVLVAASATFINQTGSQSHTSEGINGENIIKEAIIEHQASMHEGSFQPTEERGKTIKQKDDFDLEIFHMDSSESSFIFPNEAEDDEKHQITCEEAVERDSEEKVPLRPHPSMWAAEEQTEPLDLSLPKKRDSGDRRCGRLLDDQGCESSLIMEVDEYEGDGDRDTVEEDQDGESNLYLSDTPEESFPLPSYACPDVLTSVPPEDCDTQNLLLIDDQGIPYTLNLDGSKVPQVDASIPRVPNTDQVNPGEIGEDESTLPPIAVSCNTSQNLDNALKTALSELHPSITSDYNDSSQTSDQIKSLGVLGDLLTNPDVTDNPESKKPSQEGSGGLSSTTGISLPTQAIQILTNPAASTPVLFLSASTSSQLSSAPVGLTVPVSVPPPVSPTSVFLLLSSVISSSGDTTSSPVAVLDPSTGQISQITAAAASVSLPLSSGQVSALGSPLPVLSHPVILSSVNNMTSGSCLTSIAVPSSSFAVQDGQQLSTPLGHSQESSSNSNPGNEAIFTEEVSKETTKPLTSEESPSQSQSATYDFLSQPTSEVHSPASDSKLGPSDVHPGHLPLDDHLYFPNTVPPSPPIGPILPSGKLDTLEPLDSFSPEETSNSLGSRRVLCCQLCPRIFFYLSDLERHAITHSQKKPHVCQECGKAFKRSSHLQRHKHIHTGQRNFVCSICTKRFREAGELQRHQRVHTGEKPYQCQLCHTRFAERNTLRRHTKRKHPYHQAALEMLNKRRDKGTVSGEAGHCDKAEVQEEEESAEWYSSTVSTLENSESEVES